MEEEGHTRQVYNYQEIGTLIEYQQGVLAGYEVREYILISGLSLNHLA